MPESARLHRSLDVLKAAYDSLEKWPRDHGTVEMVVVRPGHDLRDTPQSIEISPQLGLDGDHWSSGETGDRPGMQVTIMNSKILGLVAGGRERWALAGDNLIVDLDLSPDNLLAGSRLSAGSAVIEITDTPHTGCAKFARRYGADALRFVNLERGRDLRFRGVYASVVSPGVVSVGDVIERI